MSCLCFGPVIMHAFLQGFAAGYVGEYLKDTSTADKFNVGEYWVDLQCVPHPSASRRYAHSRQKLAKGVDIESTYCGHTRVSPKPLHGAHPSPRQ